MANNFLIKNSINLASPVLGTKIYKFSDQFFAPALRILNDDDPIFIDDKFDNNGKWREYYNRLLKTKYSKAFGKFNSVIYI